MEASEGIEPHHHSGDDRLVRLRHSAAHVMAEAVLTFFPETKLGVGPVIEDGFYYDFLPPRPLTPEDLPRIEERMREIVATESPFVQRDVDAQTAREMFSNQPFKLELIEEIGQDRVSLFTQHQFTDLCQGPHTANTRDLAAFKILRIAGAYWRGNEQNPQLQRIYGTCWETQEELDAYLHSLEEAERRDHRRLGRELDLFIFDPIAPASPFFLPKGAVVYNLLVDYIRALYQVLGYQEVITPQIYSTELWHRSGHYDNYRESMFFTYVEEREFGVKPMNCPGHALMYASRLHSYRDLPIRYADFGRLHRYERSGVTHGLTRVRSFSQDDAHIFCRPEQIQEEVQAFIDLLLETYRSFQFEDVAISLSLRPEKRVGSEEMWDRAEDALAEVLKRQGVSYQALPGEGAFYGPKIDFLVRDALRREWQLGTVQLDFSMPERFGLEYVAEDGAIQRPVMIHRAMLGSIERFLGILIEHYAGAFPAWLAPVQAVVIPIADRHVDYARRVEARLRAEGLRVEVDTRNERMNAKVRDGQLRKIPYMLVVGDREEQEGTVALRLRTNENLGPQPLEVFIAMARDAVASRS